MKIPSTKITKKLTDLIQSISKLEDSRSLDETKLINELIENKITSSQIVNKLKEKKLFNISKKNDLEIITKITEFNNVFLNLCKELEITYNKKYVLKKRSFLNNIFTKKEKEKQIQQAPIKQKEIKEIHKEIPIIKPKTTTYKQTIKKDNFFIKINLFLKKIFSKTKTENKTKIDTEKVATYNGPKFEMPNELKPENYQALIPGFAYAFIENKNGKREYIVVEPELNNEEEKILENVKEELIDKISLIDIKDDSSLFKQVDKIFTKNKLKLTSDQKQKIIYFIARQIKGLDQIEPLMHDPLIEDIEGDGTGIPIFIVHRKYGHLSTNIVFNNEKKLQQFVIKMAHLCKSYVSYASPLLDSILPDGSRVNATLTTNVSTRGPTFTIRKFPQKPLTAIDLCNSNTLNPTLAAYLWTAIEFKKTAIIVGPTAAGKTTLLNVITSFIPPGRRVVSIEDTREINLLMDNWIPQITRPGFGPPDIRGKKYGEVTMEDLLKESFRQRPDYLVIGEVRGEEMSLMFQGMASGHCCISTVHSKSVEDLVNRLITPPISLEPSLLTSMDIVIITGFSGSAETKRAIKEIDEIRGFNIKENKIEYNAVYNVIETFNKKEEEGLFTNELPITYKSEILKDISKEHNIKLNDLLEVIISRKRFIEKLSKNPPKDYIEFKLELNKYKDTEEILKDYIN
jgi:archaeal flagellar protein FlaI